MMYLENLLSTMDSKANVIVKLSSETIYEGGLKMQDGCGNHYAQNWLDAIHNNECLERRFIVDDVQVTFEEYMDAPQWKVTLLNKKCEWTNILDRDSNAAAIKNSFNF